ncbi:sigma factor-like helix-turn-helix DNA-binding protein [Streptomyces sp. NPDC086010]|uniref:sigma factor-like helix-turn-helix DNA-binding protein n=1 Tax=Streptomyces sp. NPDC086010 TaxID=3365745 RepID=UPI0037D0E7E7
MTRSVTDPSGAAPLPSPKERRRLREARSLSEEQVAAAMGVTPATVRAWETGRSTPRGRRRTAYARLIGSDAPRTTPHPSAVEATGSSTMSPTEPGTGAIAGAPADPATDVVPDATAPESSSSGRVPRENGRGTDVAGPPVAVRDLPASSVRAAPAPRHPGPAAPDPDGDPPATVRPVRTPEAAFDSLYDLTAPGLTRQMYLLTGRRLLSREAVEHAFRIAWQRWPEVARDRDPAGWARAAAYEYAMSPWHRMRRIHRRPDALPDEPGRKALLGALLALPPSYRRTLLLHDGVGLGLPETAAETEASTPAAANRLLNARAALTVSFPELAAPTDPGGRTALFQERLGALALAEDVPRPPGAPSVRRGSERVAELWTRAAICFGVVLIGATGFTLHTAPTQYEQPLSPPQRVGGVPPRGGPERLTPQDLKLQKALREKLVHGPERLVPRIP